jgi:hypothetical protein
MIATRPTYATPFHDLFRPLTADERQDLRASIKEHGVQVPVTVYQSAEHGPAIIDGMNRWSVCQELGVDCPVNDLGEMSDADALELAEQLNHCRRHLTPKEWHEARAARAERVKRDRRWRSSDPLREGRPNSSISLPVFLLPQKVSFATMGGRSMSSIKIVYTSKSVSCSKTVCYSTSRFERISRSVTMRRVD